VIPTSVLTDAVVAGVTHHSELSVKNLAMDHIQLKLEAPCSRIRNLQKVRFWEKLIEAVQKFRPNTVTEMRPFMGPVRGKIPFTTGSTYIAIDTSGAPAKLT
jgi:hypothetical protein